MAARKSDSQSEVNIKILKYDELFTKRAKDLKKNLWFSFPNDLMTHPDFFNITGDEFKAFLWCVSVCSKCSNSEIRLDIDHASYLLKIKNSVFESMIDKLKGKQIDVVRDRDTAAAVPGTASTIQDKTNKTIQDNTEQEEPDVTETPARLFPFSNLIYFEEISKIKESIITEWAKEFDHNFLSQEISKAKLWCMANEKKKPKDSTRFLNNWFSKGWEDYRKKIPSVTPITKSGEMSEASKIAYNRLKEKGLV